MAVTGALASLAVQIGPAVAKSVVSSLSNRPKGGENLKKVEALITTGTTAVDAFRKIFGSDFHEALNGALGTGQASWTYEAGKADYIRLETQNDDRDVYQVLRDELNVNLDRIAKTYGKNRTEVQNYFLGVFREWMTRYKELVGSPGDSMQTFEAIESLLDGQKRTLADVFRLLQQTGLGAIGTFLILQAVLVATSTGVGVLAAIHTWLLGIPVVQVGALATGGAVLLALSRIKLTPTNAMSASVSVAYKLLERTADNAKASSSS